MPTELTLTEQNPYTELTLLQKRYVEARLQGLNKSASYRAAGGKEGGHDHAGVPRGDDALHVARRIRQPKEGSSSTGEASTSRTR